MSVKIMSPRPVPSHINYYVPCSLVASGTKCESNKKRKSPSKDNIVQLNRKSPRKLFSFTSRLSSPPSPSFLRSSVDLESNLYFQQQLDTIITQTKFQIQNEDIQLAFSTSPDRKWCLISMRMYETEAKSTLEYITYRIVKISSLALIGNHFYYRDRWWIGGGDQQGYLNVSFDPKSPATILAKCIDTGRLERMALNRDAKKYISYLSEVLYFMPTVLIDFIFHYYDD